jgi:putative ATP-dependent endonuclease of OLD family
VVVLQSIPKEGHTVARSLAGIKLKVADREDLERYLDVTRGELFFSKGVILVEGDAEKFLLPTMARLYDKSFDFDAMGITVCSIAGTNFAPYVKLLGPEGLDIPFAILTDFDPKGSEVSQEDDDPEAKHISDSYGKSRVINHIMRALLPPKTWDDLTGNNLLKLAPSRGVFLNEFTFEVDVFNAGAEEHFQKTAKGLSANKKMHARFKALAEDPDSLDEKLFLKDIDSIGKGRFAQRLASTLRAADADVCPTYVKDALEYMREKLR